MQLNKKVNLRNLRLQQEAAATREKREKKQDLLLWTAIAILSWVYVTAEIISYVKG